jgi:hypothetical protein
MSNPMIGNFSVDEIYNTVLTKGMSPSVANAFVGEWLLVNAGKARRVFNYSQAFNAVEAACTANFVRSFVHADWIDGESVVQASETPEEQGFNQRFHRLEADLDALGGNVALTFTCMANLRRELKNLLEEIRAELNRINADLDPRRPDSPVRPGLVDSGTFLGKFKINEAPMQLWQTATGMFMLPDVETLSTPIWNDPRTLRFSQLSRYIEENAQVRTTFPQAVSKAEFLRSFGNERVADGTFVRDLIAMLPEEARYASIDEMSADLTTRETAAFRTTPGAREAAAVSLGLGGKPDQLGEASVDVFNALPADARSALSRNGVTTISKLADMPAEKITSLFKKEKVQDVSRGDIAGALALAKSIRQL